MQTKEKKKTRQNLTNRKNVRDNWSPEIDYLLATSYDKAKCFESMHTEAFAISYAWIQKLRALHITFISKGIKRC